MWRVYNYSQSDFPLNPPYGSNWGHKNSGFGPYANISFKIAFTVLEFIEKVQESIYRELF